MSFVLVPRFGYIGSSVRCPSVTRTSTVSVVARLRELTLKLSTAFTPSTARVWLPAAPAGSPTVTVTR